MKDFTASAYYTGLVATMPADSGVTDESIRTDEFYALLLGTRKREQSGKDIHSVIPSLAKPVIDYPFCDGALTALKRNIANSLDRNGGRAILAKITTSLARPELGGDVDVFHDDRLRIHRVNPTFFPASYELLETFCRLNKLGRGSVWVEDPLTVEISGS